MRRSVWRDRCPLVWVARIGTVYYFGFFWLIMPIVGLIETPKPLPASIANPCSSLPRRPSEEHEHAHCTSVSDFRLRSCSAWRPRRRMTIAPPAMPPKDDELLVRRAVRHL